MVKSNKNSQFKWLHSDSFTVRESWIVDFSQESALKFAGISDFWKKMRIPDWRFGFIAIPALNHSSINNNINKKAPTKIIFSLYLCT